MHAKTAMVDQAYAILSTASLDYRSVFLNYELNLISREPQLCRRLQEQFEKDLEQSEEMFVGRWSEQLTEALGWMARRWL